VISYWLVLRGKAVELGELLTYYLKTNNELLFPESADLSDL